MLLPEFLNTLLDWLSDLASEEMPDDIQVINIGIFKSTNGYQLYLTGAKHYDPENPDWATVIDYKPKEMYLPVQDTVLNKLSWQKFLVEIEQALRIVQAHHLNDTVLSKVQHVTFGFDDGDLHVLI